MEPDTVLLDKEKDESREELSLTDAESENDNLLGKKHASRPGPRRLIVGIVISSILNALLLVVLVMVLERPIKDPSQRTYSPAQHLIEYETVVFHASHGDDLSPYQGWPDDRNDNLWRDSYSRGVAIYISEEENSRIPNATEHIAIPGLQDKYLIGLDMFHQLHCLNSLRKSLYPERYHETMYYPNGTLDHLMWLHYDHCIDTIRQSIMCHGDISTMWFKWNATAHKIKPRLDVTHTCRKFEPLRDWAFSRSVDEFDNAKHVENGEIIQYPRPTWQSKWRVNISSWN